MQISRRLQLCLYMAAFFIAAALFWFATKDVRDISHANSRALPFDDESAASAAVIYLVQTTSSESNSIFLIDGRRLDLSKSPILLGLSNYTATQWRLPPEWAEKIKEPHPGHLFWTAEILPDNALMVLHNENESDAPTPTLLDVRRLSSTAGNIVFISVSQPLSFDSDLGSIMFAAVSRGPGVAYVVAILLRRESPSSPWHVIETETVAWS